MRENRDQKKLRIWKVIQLESNGKKKMEKDSNKIEARFVELWLANCKKIQNIYILGRSATVAKNERWSWFLAILKKLIRSYFSKNFKLFTPHNQKGWNMRKNVFKIAYFFRFSKKLFFLSSTTFKALLMATIFTTFELKLVDCSKLVINRKNDNDLTVCWHDLIAKFFWRGFVSLVKFSYWSKFFQGYSLYRFWVINGKLTGG